MMRGAPLAVALVAALAAAPARADTVTAGITDTAVTPSSLTVLAGDTVGWRNGSLVLQHTVTGNGFDSGPIQPGGGYFREFSEPGSFPYACTFHPIITGRVDVFRLLLGAPPRAVARAAATVLSGRAGAGIGGVTVEEETGTGFHAVAQAQVHGGLFHATVSPPANALYRAVAGAATSPPVRVEVSDRNDVAITRRRHRLVLVHVDPLSPGAKVSLQLKLRERFGWWTVRRARLDRRSGARFRLRAGRRVWARVVLTRSDGWTPLAVSPVVRVRGR